MKKQILTSISLKFIYTIAGAYTNLLHFILLDGVHPMNNNLNYFSYDIFYKLIEPIMMTV
jgi:hypothetical protein